MKCETCGRKDSLFCVICDDEDMYVTREEEEYIERMCDLLCGEIEDDE